MGLAQPQKRFFTPEEYLESERESLEKHEWYDGEVFARESESIAHGHICVNLVAEISKQLKGKPCATFTKDTKVRSGSDIELHKTGKGFFSYPDVVVVCGELRFHDKFKDVILNPTVIIEVLSESTEAFDCGDKFQRFRKNLPTLSDYVVVSPRRPFVDHYRRSENGEWILTTTTDIEGFLELRNIECRIALAEIYECVEFSEEIIEYQADDFDSDGSATVL